MRKCNPTSWSLRSAILVCSMLGIHVPAFADDPPDVVRYDEIVSGLKESPDKASAYISAIERLYNSRQRDQALAVIELGLQVESVEPTIWDAQLAIYRFEEDWEKVEQTHAVIIDGMIEGRQAERHLGWSGVNYEQSEPDAIRKRLLERYAKRYEEVPENEALFDNLKAHYEDLQQHDQLLSLYEMRLRAVPDASLASTFLHRSLEAKQFDKLTADIDTLPRPVRDNEHFLLSQMEAWLALDRIPEAMRVGAIIEKNLGPQDWSRQRLARLYHKIGRTDKALEIIQGWASPGNHLKAIAAATYGGREEALACVQQCIDRDAPAWVLFQCVDACRLVGDDNRAEAIFDVAENKTIEELRGGQGIAYEIYYRYAQEGRLERYAEVFGPYHPNAYQIFMSAAQAHIKSNQPGKAIALLERNRAKYEDNREYLTAAAMTLENLGEHQRAKSYYGSALAIAEATDRRANPALADPVAGKARCFMALKEFDACDEWASQYSRDSPNWRSARAAMGRYWEQAGDKDKAIATYRLSNDHANVIRLVRQTSGDAGVVAYITAIPNKEAQTYWQRSEELRHPSAQIARARAAIERDPDSANAFAELGRQLFFAGQIAEGRQAFRKAVALQYDFKLVPPLQIYRPFVIAKVNPLLRGRPDYSSIMGLYLQRDLQDELEHDFAPLIGLTKAHRWRHHKLIERWHDLHSKQ